MEHLLQRTKHSIFHNIFKYVVFQRRQKELLWSKGLHEAVQKISVPITYALSQSLNKHAQLSWGARCLLSGTSPTLCQLGKSGTI